MKKLIMCPRVQKRAKECFVVTGIMSVIAYLCGIGFGEALYQVLYF